MKNVYFILMISITSLALSGQDYFHKIIDYPYGIPIIAEAQLLDSAIVTASIHATNQTTITSIDLTSFTASYKTIDDISVSRHGLSIAQDSIYIFGKNRTITDNLEFIACHEEEMNRIQVNTNIDGQYVFPNSYCAAGGYHYFGYDTKIDSLDKLTFGLQKRRSNGDLIWEHFYGIENGANSINEMGIAANGDILCVGIARRIPPTPMNRTQLLLYRISQDGNLINTFLQEETAELGEISYIAPLLNNHVITGVNVERGNDWDFYINDWYPFPYKLHWVDENGNQYREKLIITDRPNELYLFNIVPSKYFEHFFLVGFSYDAEAAIDYGYISKISYNGEILWERKYVHPDFNFGSNSLRFSDILERSNGDIFAVGRAGLNNGDQDIWIMKVNADGCFGDGEDCGEGVITTSTEDIEAPAQLLIYPNPATSILNIVNPDDSRKIVRTRILDMTGAVLKSISTDMNQIQFNIDELLSGMYIIEIEYADGKKVYKKFIVVK